MNYEDFLETKRHSHADVGIEPNFMPSDLFEYQKFVARKGIKKGRCAEFLDTGLGKTIIEIVTAKNYHNHTKKPVLIITPLAVAFQFIKEAKKFNIDDISYSRDGRFDSSIVVCNYERIDKFRSEDFDCVILDESSILKNFDGAIKDAITIFMRKVKYRYLFTATPSPNDYIELGTSSEALGYLGYMDMLTKFFKNNRESIDIRNSGCEWYLKPHAERDFWRWVSSWSISMRRPSDLGFSDSFHVLPELIENDVMVRNTKPLERDGQMMLLNQPAINFHEIKQEVRATIEARCEAAVNCSSNHETSVYWVNLNDEAKLIKDLDDSAIEIKGAMELDEKEEILVSFSDGGIKKLITKPSITAFGLNWQHCNHTVYFPTYSYEQYYQSIRRFWRFGQKKPVVVDRVLSDGQTRIMQSLSAKGVKAGKMFENLTKQTSSDFTIKTKAYTGGITLPSFLKD